MNRQLNWRIACLLLLAFAPMALLADGEQLVTENCASCHQVNQPAAHPDRSTRLERVAPPLYYAGNKYREPWLFEWLQNPRPIHPAGYLPAAKLRTAEDGDRPVREAMEKHLSLSGEEARAVTDYLMSRRPKQHLMDEDHYEPGSVAMRMGMMDFRRFKGCDACHQDDPDSGGLSGPELHTAWQRLQPGYLSSFIQNPVAWDPLTTMPVLSLNEDSVHQLVDYLRMIGEEE